MESGLSYGASATTALKTHLEINSEPEWRRCFRIRGGIRTFSAIFCVEVVPSSTGVETESQ